MFDWLALLCCMQSGQTYVPLGEHTNTSTTHHMLYSVVCFSHACCARMLFPNTRPIQTTTPLPLRRALCDGAAAQRRTAAHSRPLHGHDRHGLQPAAQKHQAGQGRGQPLARAPPISAWCGDEPRRPSTWRWPGQEQRSDFAVPHGGSCQGFPHPEKAAPMGQPLDHVPTRSQAAIQKVVLLPMVVHTHLAHIVIPSGPFFFTRSQAALTPLKQQDDKYNTTASWRLRWCAAQSGSTPRAAA